MTGTMWQDVVRYQFNVGLSPDYVQLQASADTRSLRLGYLDQPIPVYWVESSSIYNDDGIADFYSKVTTTVSQTVDIL